MKLKAKHNINTPEPRLVQYDWMSIDDWNKRHQQQLHLLCSQQEVDVLFIGDSITEGWPEDLWDTHFKPLKSAKFAIGGDQTQNLLWRLLQVDQQIEQIKNTELNTKLNTLKNIKPKVIVLLIGVNNFGHGNHTSEQTAQGVQIVVEQLLKQFPDSHIILHSIFPCDQFATEGKREKVIKANELISENFNQHPRIVLLKIWHEFLNDQQEIEASIMEDYLHLTHLGYEIWLEKLLTEISRLLNQNG